jgi:uncharacterized protein (DUF2236 family)
VVLLLAWGRAILLQFAHPLVAAGVAEHSLFIREPRGRLRRLRHTLGAMLALTFGSAEEIHRAARGINAIHDRVNGTLSESSGPFGAGHRYSAHDPALLRWVHATLLDSLPLAYERFVGPLTAEEKDRYCAEASGMELVLGIPSGYLPRDTAALRAYMEGMYASGEIVVGETARRLAGELLAPPVPALAPVSALLNLPAIGLLPPAVRESYGLEWGPGREAVLRGWAGLTRTVLPLVPPALRTWPPSRRRQRRAGGGRPDRGGGYAAPATGATPS